MSSNNEICCPRKFKCFIISFSLLFCCVECVVTGNKNWDPNCPSKWPSCTHKGENYTHTTCQFESCDPRFKNCFELPSDREFRRMVLDKHNELRNKVASGEETRSGFVAAADMMAFSYDLELEFTAICQVHGCAMEHDMCKGTKKFPNGSQNLARRHLRYQEPMTEEQINDLIQLRQFKELVTAWYETEIVNDDFTHLIDKKYHTDTEIGHLIALVWAKSSYIGCAKALQKDNANEATIHITCNYGLQGNIGGRPIYTKGPACSKCPEGTSCNAKYTSLCGEIDDKDVDTGLNPYRKIDMMRGKVAGDSKLHSSSAYRSKVHLLRSLIVIIFALKSFIITWITT